MSTEETVTFNLELNVEPSAISNIRQVEGLLFRTLGLLGRLGLPPQIDHAIRKLQQLVMTIRLAHSAMIALEAASGPISWWRAGLAIGSSVALATDFAMNMGE